MVFESLAPNYLVRYLAVIRCFVRNRQPKAEQRQHHAIPP